MQVTAVFNHPEDSYYWRLFTNMEKLLELAEDVEMVLECVENNDYEMLKSDHELLLIRVQELLAEVGNKNSQE